MMRTKPLTAQARVALASGAPLTVVAWVSAVAALYLFAGAGAWAAGFTASGEVLGFLPDPAYAAGVSGCGAAEAVAAAALAHAAVLPVAAVAVAYLVLREGFSSGAAAVSFARGARRGAWLARSTAIVSAAAGAHRGEPRVPRRGRVRPARRWARRRDGGDRPRGSRPRLPDVGGARPDAHGSPGGRLRHRDRFAASRAGTLRRCHRRGRACRRPRRDSEEGVGLAVPCHLVRRDAVR